MAKVFGRLVAGKNQRDSITDRESDRYVEASLKSGFHTVTVFARPDGRAVVEVKTEDGRIMQYLNLMSDGTLASIGGNIINGDAL